MKLRNNAMLVCYLWGLQANWWDLTPSAPLGCTYDDVLSSKVVLENLFYTYSEEVEVTFSNYAKLNINQITIYCC